MTITRLAVAAAGVAVLTACSSPEPPAPAVAPVPAASGAPPASPAAETAIDLSRPEIIATGLDVPWGLAFE
ncbi:MAG TPA: PQQ-dependent sugar dehydrogenase, partial [Actinoplanes sp.]|nr:PQQ-dependent sugar dehydrogenase [Actinoplanes sp.]